MTVYSAVIMAGPLQEFTRFIQWMQTKRQTATNPQTKPTDLGCESTCRLLPSTLFYHVVSYRCHLLLPI